MRSILMMPPRTAPWILQPFLLPYLQRPLLDEVNRKALSSRNSVAACRVFDQTQYHLHVVYLVFLFPSRRVLAVVGVFVPSELVHAIATPSTTGR